MSRTTLRAARLLLRGGGCNHLRVQASSIVPPLSRTGVTIPSSSLFFFPRPRLAPTSNFSTLRPPSSSKPRYGSDKPPEYEKSSEKGKSLEKPFSAEKSGSESAKKKREKSGSQSDKESEKPGLESYVNDISSLIAIVTMLLTIVSLSGVIAFVSKYF